MQRNRLSVHLPENDNTADSNETTTNALQKHMGWFAKNNQINEASLKEKLIALGDTQAEATSLACGVMFAGGLATGRCPFGFFKPNDAVGKLHHPRSTKMFNADGDGSFNETRWNELLTYTEIDKGTKIITQSKLYEFLNWCRQQDNAWDVFNLGKTASNGEWEQFFLKCTNYWKAMDEGGYEPCVTVKNLELFFKNTPIVFDQVVSGELPTPRPR